MPWKHNGRTIKVGKAWVSDSGVKHPSVWMRWSSSEKTNNGLTWEDPPASEAPFDNRFYWGRQTDGTLIERSLTDINEVDSDEVINRTLNTNNPENNESLWINAGYKKIPTIQENISELAKSNFTKAILN